MSDPNQFQPPPPPGAPELAPAGPRPTKIRPIAIGLAVIGLLVLLCGIAKILPGGFFTGLAFLFWGLLLFGLSFIRLPEASVSEEPPMSPVSGSC